MNSNNGFEIRINTKNVVILAVAITSVLAALNMTGLLTLAWAWVFMPLILVGAFSIIAFTTIFIAKSFVAFIKDEMDAKSRTFGAYQIRKEHMKKK